MKKQMFSTAVYSTCVRYLSLLKPDAFMIAGSVKRYVDHIHKVVSEIWRTFCQAAERPLSIVISVSLWGQRE